MEKKRAPIRMCISCRRREPQKYLFRLQAENRRVIPYRGYGRSFYICKECFNSKEKLIKRVSKILKVEKDSLEVVLKELENNVKNQN